jgi:transposase
MGLGRELSVTDRARILELHSIGWGYKRIYKKHPEWSLSTIRYTVKKADARGPDCKSLKRSGHPQHLTVEERDHVYDVITHQNPNITTPDLLAQVDDKVKKRSMQYLCRDLGRRKWIRRKRVALTAERAAARLAWAETYQHFQPQDWKRVKWSDESTIERGQGSAPVWTFLSFKEQLERGDVTPVRACGKGVKQMFWAGFGHGIRTPLVTMMGDPESRRGGVTARRVVETYQNQLRNLIRPGDIFMHDNAPVHRAHIVRDLLEEMKTYIVFEVMDWPPYSPDLNPIENMWKLLKQEIYRRYPDLMIAPDNEETRVRIVAAAIEVWVILEVDILDHLSDTMPNRVRAVLHAGGWYTKY